MFLLHALLTKGEKRERKKKTKKTGSSRDLIFAIVSPVYFPSALRRSNQLCKRDLFKIKKLCNSCVSSCFLIRYKF